MKRRTARSIVSIGVAALALASAALPASAGGRERDDDRDSERDERSNTVLVTNDAPAGPGSFAAAVEHANSNPRVGRIVFTDTFTVAVTSEITYTGDQDLSINGRGSTLSGADATPDTDTWDSGLFVSRSGADLSIKRLSFNSSFNNGLAVFLPAGGGEVEIELENVEVVDSQFHGILVDGQSTTGYNTDDFIHPLCTDPHPVDSGTTIEIEVNRTTITNSGRVAGFDITQATGCPQDFDGLRVDQGGPGDLRAEIERSTFAGNLADGVELDETGEGANWAEVSGSTFVDNGATAEILCSEATYCGGDTGSMIEDLDDAFDMDEADDGDMVALIRNSVFSDNNDEGIDLDEAGEGSAILDARNVTANSNLDEGVKITEEDGGDIRAQIRNSTIDSAETADNAEFEELGEGDNIVSISRTSLSAGDGVVSRSPRRRAAASR
ncbi:MAG: hypothetical protein R2770_18310 [Acidimicrobiales bacterium]